MKTITQIGELFRQLGLMRFVLLFAAMLAPILAYGVLFDRLAADIGWPEDYGFTCQRKCTFVHMWNSHKLLTGGTGPELMLFAVIWFAPVIVAVASITIIARRRLKQRRDRIRPMRRD